jgi:hypothetical protein
MRKNAIRLLILATLLIAGGAIQLHAASVPAPTPHLPPIVCN